MCASQLRAIMTADDEFDATMQLLSDRGVLANTLVIFSSDNGYMWSDHGRTEKFVPYEPSVRVPLLPALARPHRGRHRHHPARLVRRPAADDAGGGRSSRCRPGRRRWTASRCSARARAPRRTPSTSRTRRTASVPTWKMIRTATVKYIQTYDDDRHRDRSASTTTSSPTRTEDTNLLATATRPTTRRPPSCPPWQPGSTALGTCARQRLRGLTGRLSGRRGQQRRAVNASTAASHSVRQVAVQAVTAGQLDEPVGRQGRPHAGAGLAGQRAARPVRSAAGVRGDQHQHRHVGGGDQRRDVPSAQPGPQPGRDRGRVRLLDAAHVVLDVRRAPSPDGRRGTAGPAGPGPAGRARRPARRRGPAPRPAGRPTAGRVLQHHRAGEAGLAGDRADRGRGAHAVPDEQVDRPADLGGDAVDQRVRGERAVQPVAAVRGQVERGDVPAALGQRRPDLPPGAAERHHPVQQDGRPAAVTRHVSAMRPVLPDAPARPNPALADAAGAGAALVDLSGSSDPAPPATRRPGDRPATRGPRARRLPAASRRRAAERPAARRGCRWGTIAASSSDGLTTCQAAAMPRLEAITR